MMIPRSNNTPRPVRKFFLCTGECVQWFELVNFPESHIIGELRYVPFEGEKVTALAVYEISLPTSMIPPIKTEIRVEIIGDARRIRCTVRTCEQLKRWEIGRPALHRLIQRYEHAML